MDGRTDGRKYVETKNSTMKKKGKGNVEDT